jgi:hypothetical protein
MNSLKSIRCNEVTSFVPRKRAALMEDYMDVWFDNINGVKYQNEIAMKSSYYLHHFSFSQIEPPGMNKVRNTNLKLDWDC